MSDNIETNGTEATFASLRVPAWHGLGTVFDDEVSTSTMLDLAHLSGWDVRLVPLADVTDFDSYASDINLVVRTNPFNKDEADVLATVGGRYTPFQNEAAFAFGDNLLDGGGAWETAGSIAAGRVVFGSLSFGERVLDPNGRADKIDEYLLIHTSHDGTTPLQASVTPVRVVCQNTLNVALRSVSQTFKIRHTGTIDGRVAAAREALSLRVAYMDAFQAEAEALIRTEITEATFDEIILAAFPKPEADAKASLTRWENRVAGLHDLWTGPTNTTVRGTAWGAFNVLTEAQQWLRTARVDNPTGPAEAGSGFDIQSNKFRNDALATVRKVVGV